MKQWDFCRPLHHASTSQVLRKEEQDHGRLISGIAFPFLYTHTLHVTCFVLMSFAKRASERIADSFTCQHHFLCSYCIESGALVLERGRRDQWVFMAFFFRGDEGTFFGALCVFLLF